MGEALRIIIHYEKKDEVQDLIVSIYLFHYIRIYKINLIGYLKKKIDEYLNENLNNSFSTKSYINYKNSAKIIWNRIEKFKKNIYISIIDMNMHIGTRDPAATAIIYGIVNGIAPNVLNFINQFISIRHYHLKIFPQFDSSVTNVSLNCEMIIRPVFVTFQYIFIKRRLKNDKLESTSN